MTTLASERMRVRVRLDVDVLMDPDVSDQEILDEIERLDTVLEHSTARDAISDGMYGTGANRTMYVEGLAVVRRSLLAEAPYIVSQTLEESLG